MIRNIIQHLKDNILYYITLFAKIEIYPLRFSARNWNDFCTSNSTYLATRSICQVM